MVNKDLLQAALGIIATFASWLWLRALPIARMRFLHVQIRISIAAIHVEFDLPAILRPVSLQLLRTHHIISYRNGRMKRMTLRLRAIGDALRAHLLQAQEGRALLLVVVPFLLWYLFVHLFPKVFPISIIVIFIH